MFLLLLLFFLFVFQKSSSFCRENEKKKKKTKNLDQCLTLKRAKIGPFFNFSAYIYTHTYKHMISCGRFLPHHGGNSLLILPPSMVMSCCALFWPTKLWFCSATSCQGHISSLCPLCARNAWFGTPGIPILPVLSVFWLWELSRGDSDFAAVSEEHEGGLKNKKTRGGQRIKRMKNKGEDWEEEERKINWKRKRYEKRKWKKKKTRSEAKGKKNKSLSWLKSREHWKGANAEEGDTEVAITADDGDRRQREPTERKGNKGNQPPFFQNSPDWGQSRKIMFSKFPGSKLMKI